MSSTIGLILAAGRGSRMLSLTDARPKCLVELAGKPLLHWQMRALSECGIGDLAVVSGYLGHMLEPGAQEGCGAAYEILRNPEWAETNMLSTLLCAAPWLDERFSAGARQAVISYSDIVYHPSHVAALAEDRHDLAITYDTFWEPLWRLRFNDPLVDAETFSHRDGLLLGIGGRPDTLEAVDGQYMGLLKMSAKGWGVFKHACEDIGPAVRNTDMTKMLSLLLQRKEKVGVVPVRGKWCEVDSEEDLSKYVQALQRDGWTHDWRP